MGIDVAIMAAGAFVALFGLAIMENAAFADRMKFGFWAFLWGAVFAFFGFIHIVVRLVWS